MPGGNQDQVMKLSRNSRILIAAFAVLVLVLIITAILRDTDEYVSKIEIALGTTVKVVIASDKNPALMIDSVLREFRRIENKFSVNKPDSEISRINRNGEQPYEMDEETAFVVERALTLAKATNGAFDPALGNLITLWGFDRIGEMDFEGRLPSDDAIQAAVASSGYEKVEVEGVYITLHNGVRLDLGGIVKGYAIDRGIAIAKEMDPNATGYIDAGRDIGFIGPKFNSDSWSVGVQHPRSENPSDYLAVVYLDKGSIVTSGDYERFFEIEGVRYHHIINPKTGYPVRDTISTTVISPTSMDADALSTAAFVLGGEFASVILPSLGGQGLFMDDAMKKYTTEGWSFFTEKR